MSKVVIYTKSHCPYCVSAKQLLQQKNIPFEEIFMDDRPEEYARLKSRTGLMTVPQIFIGDTFVGGFRELSELERNKQLDAMLAR